MLTMGELLRLLAFTGRAEIWERHFHAKPERDRLLLAFEKCFLTLWPGGFIGPSEQLLPTEPALDGRGITISVDRG